MIRDLGVRLGIPVEGEWITLTPDHLQRYRQAVGAAPAQSATGETPLGFLLAARGDALPAVRLSDGVINVHAGHLLRAAAPLPLPLRCRPLARIDRVFEKSGRRGPLTVIARTTTLHGEDGRALCHIEDQQILRRPEPIAASGAAPFAAPTSEPAPFVRLASPGDNDALEPGETIAVERRHAPDVAAIRRYAEPFAGGDPLFVDADLARRLGFDDVIVPGPLQSALLEALVTRALPAWRLQQLACTFRISLITAEWMTMSAVVTELERGNITPALHLDLTIENAVGERAATGSAILRPRI